MPGKEWINLTVLRRRADATPNVKVVTLKYAQATEVAEVLKQVYDKGPAKIVPDARTNSVIVTGPETQLEEIEALLLKLDEGGPATPNARSVPVDPAQSEAAKLVVQLEDELAQVQLSVGANHPKVKELQGRLAAARQNVQLMQPPACPELRPRTSTRWARSNTWMPRVRDCVSASKLIRRTWNELRHS